MNICLIPARGGSKRIPHKNIKEFFGEPIIAYAISTAREVFDVVVVSTDDATIASIALNYRADIFMRSKETSTDEAMLADVILEYINKVDFKSISLCCLLPCTPLLKAENLQEALQLYETGFPDSVVPVVQYPLPYQRALMIDSMKIKMINEGMYNVRSQDLPPIYYDPGQFWILNKYSFLDYKKLYMPNSIPYLMSEMNTQDVDTIEDWEMLELKYRRLNNG